MAWRDRETTRERRARYGQRGTSLGYVTATVDTRSIDRLLADLEAAGKQGKKAIKHSARIALEVINEETSQKAQDLPLKPSGKGWRRMIKRKTSFVYRTRRTKNYSFWFFTAVNYRKETLRISHLIEKGFQHARGTKVPGNWYRAAAFEKKRSEALKRFESNLLWGLRLIARGKPIPNLTKYRKRLAP